MIIIMLGAQGTGKGTVAGLLNEKKGWVQLSTGDVFRKNIKEETELGKEANKYISKGMLVPDEITVPMVINQIDELAGEEGIILDGFPRTVEQAEKLDSILSERNKEVNLVVNLVTPRDEIVERITNRRVCTNQSCKATYNLVMHPPVKEGICDKCGSELVQREDDKDEASINQRLQIYDEKTLPLVDYYNKKGLVKEEEISQRINRLADTAVEDLLTYIDNNKIGE